MLELFAMPEMVCFSGHLRLFSMASLTLDASKQWRVERELP
jgi:hypothetical protein